MIYDVISQNLLIICDQAKQAAILKFLMEKLGVCQTFIGNGWMRVTLKLEQAEST